MYTKLKTVDELYSFFLPRGPKMGRDKKISLSEQIMRVGFSAYVLNLIDEDLLRGKPTEVLTVAFRFGIQMGFIRTKPRRRSVFSVENSEATDLRKAVLAKLDPRRVSLAYRMLGALKGVLARNVRNQDLKQVERLVFEALSPMTEQLSNRRALETVSSMFQYDGWKSYDWDEYFYELLAVVFDLQN